MALIPQRDTIITAKSVASLDQLSDGRFIFAIGGGWNVEEMENHGAPLREPFQALARTRPGHEGALDRAGRIPRRVRQLRSGLALSQAEAEAASTHLPRRRERPYRASW